jgi:hypothetical protein
MRTPRVNEHLQIGARLYFAVECWCRGGRAAPGGGASASGVGGVGTAHFGGLGHRGCVWWVWMIS